MSIHRIINKTNYTKISNSIFRNKKLSLKAKGLLALMLSCSDSFQFSVSGLVAMNRDGKDSINAALHELEDAGYIERTRDLTKVGSTNKYIYDVFESPKTTSSETTDTIASDASPDTVTSHAKGITTVDTIDSTPVDKPSRHAANPTAGYPIADNLPERIINEGIINNEKENTSVTNPSTVNVIPSTDEIRLTIMSQISYDDHVDVYNRNLVDNLVSVMTSMQSLALIGNPIRCGDVIYPADLVLAKLKMVSWDHIEYILGCIKNRTDPKPIGNIMSYLRTSILNATDTIDAWYLTAVQHDMKMGPSSE